MEKNANPPIAKADPGKKDYHPPKLFVYGNIPEITRQIGMTGSNDGGHGSDKTGLP